MLSEYYQSIGQPLPSVQDRAVIANQYGITNYMGTAEQNNALEAKLRAGSGNSGGSTTPPTTNNPAATALATPQTAGQTTSSSGNYDLNAIVDAMMSKGYNNRDEAMAVAKGDPERFAREYLGITTGGSGGAGGLPAAPTINLNDQYNNLISESGISDIERQANETQAQIDALEQEAADARAKVGENPFLSEAALNGRIAKIDKKLGEKTAVLAKQLGNFQTSIQSKKDEVNNKLGLTVQQYNLDRAAKQDNMTNFNTLLASGALIGATAADIAALAQQTGLAPSFIQSAIKQSQVSEPQIITQTDDNGNVSIISIDKKTGNILNTVSAGKLGKADNSGGGSSAGNIKASFKTDAESVQGRNIEGTWVGQFPQLVLKYAPYMSLEEIYKEYLATPLGKKYGTPSEDPSDIKSLYQQARGE